jgi:hypothetical protein
MGRRSPGDGSFYQRKDGLWVARLNGQYRYSKDKTTAKAKLLKLLTDTEEVKPENITVATLMDRWLEYAAPNLKPGTIKRYREAIKIYKTEPRKHQTPQARRSHRPRNVHEVRAITGYREPTAVLIKIDPVAY